MIAKELGLEAVYPNDGFGQFPPWAGITLRQHFAGLAMQGNLAADTDGIWPIEKLADHSVRCADALLAELAKETQK